MEFPVSLHQQSIIVNEIDQLFNSFSIFSLIVSTIYVMKFIIEFNSRSYRYGDVDVYLLNYLNSSYFSDGKLKKLI